MKNDEDDGTLGEMLEDVKTNENDVLVKRKIMQSHIHDFLSFFLQLGALQLLSFTTKSNLFDP